MSEGKCGVGIVEQPIAPQYTRRDTIIVQMLGLMVLFLVAYTVMSYNLRVLQYAVLLVPAVLAIIKPNIIPYLLIANFFVQPAFYSAGMMRVMVIDAVFLLLVTAFISHKKNLFNAMIDRQRSLFMILCIFISWAVVGWVFNFFQHTSLANITSMFYIFNIAQLIALVMVFSHPDWIPHREKIIVFYIVCTFLEICAAVGIEVLGGARTLNDFYKLTGTLGNHHGMLANILVLGTGVASAVYFQMRHRRLVRRFSIIVCFSCIVLLFISGSRSSLLGMFLAIPVIIFLNSSHKPIAWLVFSLSISAGLVVLWTLPVMDMVRGMFDFQNMENPDLSVYGRLLIWERIYEHALYGPWIQKIVGLGIGTFNTLRFSYHLEGQTFASGGHNQYLHAFVEMGIVGLIIYLAFFVEIIRRLVIMGRNDNAAKCFLLAVLVFLFSGLTQETIWFQWVYGRFWMQYLFCYLILFNFSHKVISDASLNDCRETFEKGAV